MGLVKVKPVVSTTGLTCGTTSGSATVTSSAQFASVVSGMRIVGAGIPFNSVVNVVASTSSLTIMNAVTGDPALATATSASVTLRFGYFASAAYGSADALGFPFAVALDTIRNVVIIDTAKQLTKCRLYFFSKPFTEIADNAAWAGLAAADAANIIGYIALATSVTLTNAYIVTQAATALPVCLGANVPVWCQLVTDTDTPTMTAVDNLTVVLTGE